MSVIKCIFFSEFHPKAGPKITYQVPEDFIIKFESIQIYIITKPELKNRLITINALGYKFVGCPVVIDDAKYARNALIFNLCFVFDKDTPTCNYGPVVKKLAAYLTQLELESDFLSNDNKRQQIPNFLKQVLTGLNKNGHCSIPMGESCTIHLKVAPTISHPPQVQDHDVPILVDDKEKVMEYPWDLTTQQVLHYVDGFSHIAKMAAEADVEINLVKACIQNLIHYQVVQMVSIFQYSNMYTVTPKINRLAEDKSLQSECIQFVARKSHRLPLYRDVFMLYCSLSPGTTVKDLCSRYNPHALKIDERKLVQFGLMKGIIHRLHSYPIKLPSEVGTASLPPSYRWFNGCHSFDEICCKIGITHQDLEKIENDPNVVVCSK
ncbi:GATOR complex protein NPRL2-like [Gigantopelta aegis]|uniref:GATOR complex protein NPRL2-like n=1 Tax=Gigantopelta aegis TaxID=1735272 RepID=UPI001B8888FE|nr:GATOR complex protein NPRL2-like [Gigantopelta aegis]